MVNLLGHMFLEEVLQFKEFLLEDVCYNRLFKEDTDGFTPLTVERDGEVNSQFVAGSLHSCTRLQ